jgi:hypothetical protein
VQRADAKEALLLWDRVSAGAGARPLAEEIRATLRLHLTVGIFKSVRRVIVGL